MISKPIQLLLFFNFSLLLFATAQSKTYNDSILAYQQNYIATHEVVKIADRKYIHFYAPDEGYRIKASFARKVDKTGFDMRTSSGKKSHYFIYGLLSFEVRDTLVQLYVYQSQELMHVKDYADYLFVPFGDATSGIETYGGGRYLDFRITDIKAAHLLLDFNKAYNPYCAYTSGYNCPIPPPANLFSMAIQAGEKNYSKPYH